jgi:hypothetical protein
VKSTGNEALVLVHRVCTHIATLKTIEVGLKIVGAFVATIQLLCDIRFLTFYVVLLLGQTIQYCEDFNASVSVMKLNNSSQF